MKMVTATFCFIVDCPLNALMAALIAKNRGSIHVIYALDPVTKDIGDYVHVSRELLSNINVVSENVIEIDSADFWSRGGKESFLKFRRRLASLIKRHPKGTIYYGNIFTNPVAKALGEIVKINHLYHSPSDFSEMLFPKKGRIVYAIKSFLRDIFRGKTAQAGVIRPPIYSLLKLQGVRGFHFLDFREFHSSSVEKNLAKLTRELSLSDRNIILLISGDEPSPGDKNPSNIRRYLEPHYLAVQSLVSSDRLDNYTIWIKEHKSYFPLTGEERSLLEDKFSKLNCAVKFIADYVSREYRNLPGECLVRYGKVDYVVAEPSSFLFNIAASSVVSVAAPSFFDSLRDRDQIARNSQFIAFNDFLAHPVRLI